MHVRAKQLLDLPENAAAKRKHDRLRYAADHSMHDSPAQREYGAWCQAFEENPAREVAKAEFEEATAKLKETIQ